MRISRLRCGCDCLNDTEPYPVNQDCYPETAREITCCPGTPLGEVMTVVFSDVATVRQLVRDASDQAIWSASAISLGSGVSMDVTLECADGEWTLRRVRYDTNGTLADVTYLAETTHCGTGQTVHTLIEPIEFSQTADADPFEIVFRAPAGSSEPASATVNMLQGEEPDDPPADWVQEHTCCAACPEGSPTFYLVDFGCFLRTDADTPDIIAPPIMRLVRDCLFGDDACHWTARMTDEGWPGYAVSEAWKHLRNRLGYNADCDCSLDYDPSWDSYPKFVDVDTAYQKWTPGESAWLATTNWGCDVCGEIPIGIPTEAGVMSTTVSGVHSQGECELLRQVAAGSFDINTFTLPTLYWDLAVDGVDTTLTFSGGGIGITYGVDEAWNCFGRNTMRLLAVRVPEGVKVFPPSRICVVPARSVRPPNPCETKEQQCACCDPGWDFVTKLRFNCDGTLFEKAVVLTRETPCSADAGGTTPTAPCGCFRWSISGTCDGTSYQFELTIYCDGTTWKVRQCCKVGAAAWSCSDATVSFECLCSVAVLDFTLSGDCCCLFRDEEPPPPTVEHFCCPGNPIQIDLTITDGTNNVTLTFDGASAWIGTFTGTFAGCNCDPGGGTIYLTCFGSPAWDLLIECSGGGASASCVPTGTCDPFLFECTITGCDSNSYDIAITE